MLPALLTTKERKGGRPSWSRLLFQASTLKVIDCRNIGFPHVLRVACITLGLWVGPWQKKKTKWCPHSQALTRSCRLYAAPPPGDTATPH